MPHPVHSCIREALVGMRKHSKPGYACKLMFSIIKQVDVCSVPIHTAESSPIASLLYGAAKRSTLTLRWL